MNCFQFRPKHALTLSLLLPVSRTPSPHPRRNEDAHLLPPPPPGRGKGGGGPPPPPPPPPPHRPASGRGEFRKIGAVARCARILFSWERGSRFAKAVHKDR